ncbi:glutathione S-transferase family protein [Azospirillum melinis]|uniref:Glutathione S-transferase family protein n=1 Tax=Azospirillum melinis TaxID=328839 RepID=A0ABX2KSE0_9PROT|nr:MULTISPECIES: glutathione S-transferase family protein [Azospirillum]MBP2309301.1 glutathione S-transferase [Azospirillum melinis]NUB04421.1 glutathione S-transferase family protein [Azospirillum melinis]PWC46748.1 glutathione S-transferase [Azospirillum sp. TSA6c]
MRTLYHHPIHALSRTARVMLAEKGLPFEPVVERPWERRTEFLKLNPAAEVPVLVEEDGTVVAGGLAVIEYLEEAYPDTPLLPREIAARAEVRRVADWFLHKFEREVAENLVGEKLIKRLSGQGHPFAPAIRAGLANVTYHLDYIAFLSERRPWLAGSSFTLADIAAAVQLSCLDYIDNVPWDRSPEAKDWYARIKSRPSFRALLADNITGCPPPKHYADLDF